jgi:nucleoside phosphorylase
VYTIGNIGEHRVVTTKLPLLGRDSRSAKISSGNTTTRLLGIFQRVEHVLLVGCAGGVPHYSDHRRHPRRGDVVISFPDGSSQDNEDYVYAHFEMQKTQTNQQLISKSWMPASMELYKIVNNIRKTYNPKLNAQYPWEEYLEQGIASLYNEELDCRRPQEDKLFFTVGDKNIIEVNHPEDAEQSGQYDRRRYGLPTLRFGKIAGGEKVVKDENLRHLLSEQHNIQAFDCDMDQVMDSIEGNRKDSFIIVRSIVDYVDGTTSKEWHPYAALCAASFAKTIICALPPPHHSPY